MNLGNGLLCPSMFSKVPYFREARTHPISVVVGGIGLLWLSVTACETQPDQTPRPSVRAAVEDEPIPMPPQGDQGLDTEIGGVVSTEPWSFGGFDGELVTTPTHLLHLTIPNGRLQKALPVFTGGALRHYRSMLAEGSEAGLLDPPPERMSTFVFGTRAEWAAWTSWRLGRGAKLYLGIERGGYTIDAESVIWDIGRYDTLCMLAHEGWHQYTQSVFRHPLPAFLEEGLAAYAEGHRFRRSDAAPVFMPWRNLERYGQLRSSKYRGRLIDLDELVAKPPQYFVAGSESGLLTFYAQVWVLVHYLMEGEDGKYRAGLIKLVRDAVNGHVATSLYDADRSAGRRGRNLGPNTGRDIIATYFDEDYQSFKAGYEAFIDRVVASGNGTKIWQGRSPIE